MGGRDGFVVVTELEIGLILIELVCFIFIFVGYWFLFFVLGFYLV